MREFQHSFNLANGKEKSRKRKVNILWKTLLSSFSIFHTKIIHGEIILFDAALLVQKNTMWVGYAKQSIK